MLKRWPAIILLGVVSAVVCEELEPGSWILEIYRPDAPIDVILISVAEVEDGFAFKDMDGKTIFEDVRVVDGEIEFEHPVFEELCRLSRQADKASWQGTCPPGNEPEFDAGLTISLRPPKASDADSDAGMEDSESGDASN